MENEIRSCNGVLLFLGLDYLQNPSEKTVEVTKDIKEFLVALDNDLIEFATSKGFDLEPYKIKEFELSKRLEEALRDEFLKGKIKPGYTRR